MTETDPNAEAIAEGLLYMRRRYGYDARGSLPDAPADPNCPHCGIDLALHDDDLCAAVLTGDARRPPWFTDPARIERVARAIYEADRISFGNLSWDKQPERARELWRAMARAAVEAMQDPQP